MEQEVQASGAAGEPWEVILDDGMTRYAIFGANPWNEGHKDFAVIRAEKVMVRIYAERTGPYQEPARVPTGYVRVLVDALWRENSKELASYTPDYENAACLFLPDEISIADDGLLTALNRQQAAVDIRLGFTVRLPVEMVDLARRCLASVAAAIRAEQARLAGEDDHE